MSELTRVLKAQVLKMKAFLFRLLASYPNHKTGYLNHTPNAFPHDYFHNKRMSKYPQNKAELEMPHAHHKI